MWNQNWQRQGWNLRVITIKLMTISLWGNNKVWQNINLFLENKSLPLELKALIISSKMVLQSKQQWSSDIIQKQMKIFTHLQMNSQKRLMSLHDESLSLLRIPPMSMKSDLIKKISFKIKKKQSRKRLFHERKDRLHLDKIKTLLRQTNKLI